MSKKDEAQKLSDKLDNLRAKIDWFYGEDFTLDDAVEHYEELLQLSKEVEKDLGELKNQVTVLSKDFSK
ncbi:MAG: hypothetical protein LBL84_03045 [Candidatus Nomurabacteria bacterium]|jgi:exonuclease VII small subunit|nr:hypothetical protein [Candidatus Nomurabacteria bacterium]